jgi:hypothetical protein
MITTKNKDEIFQWRMFQNAIKIAYLMGTCVFLYIFHQTHTHTHTHIYIYIYATKSEQQINIMKPDQASNDKYITSSIQQGIEFKIRKFLW